jgi:phage terminase large subunit
MDVQVNNIYFHILQSKARVIISYGGRDSGKSYFQGGQYTPLSMLNEPYFRGVGIRRTANSIKDSVYTEIIDGISEMKLSELFKTTKTPLEIMTNNGNKMLFRGLDDPIKIKSLKGINYIWIEEAEELTEREYEDLLILLRGEGYQRMVLTYNPMDEDHFANARFVECKKDRILDTFDDGTPKVWEIDVKEEIEGEMIQYTVLVVCSTYNDNAFIEPTRKLVIEKLKETNPFLYEIYAKGKYATRGGKILTNIEQVDFSERGWTFINFDKKGYAQDFGFNHANAILDVAEKDNCLFVFDEIYEYEKDTDEIVAMANQRGLMKNLRMSCDSAEPDRIKSWKKKGYNAFGVKKYQGSVKAQIDWLKRFDKIYINTTCPNTYKESKAWMWKQNKQGNYTDEPVTVFDDAMAALRYSKDLFEQGKWGW